MYNLLIAIDASVQKEDSNLLLQNCGNILLVLANGLIFMKATVAPIHVTLSHLRSKGNAIA